MNRFEAQERFAGWHQERFSHACIAVHGRDWLGAFTVWALSSLGVGTILWLGRPWRATEALARWLLAEPPPLEGSRIHEYPLEAEYGLELDWVLKGRPIQAVVSCTEDRADQLRCQSAASKQRARWLGGSVGGGGWFGWGAPSAANPQPQGPILAMAVAALLTDAVRQVVCPLPGDLFPVDGSLNWRLPVGGACPGRPMLVGVGAIGTYLATLLAILGGGPHLLDFDRVEETNLNRQGLFTATDARRQAYKALAARSVLNRLFNGARLTAEVRRVKAPDRTLFAALRPQPTAILSAVDNAAGRLVLQGLGRDLAIPVVQGGTSTHAADCYTQTASGPLLNEQMHGALTRAVTDETNRQRQGGCAVDPSYVAPGMMAAALMAGRYLQTCRPHSGLSPVRWRSGSPPTEQGSITDAFDLQQLTVESG